MTWFSSLFTGQDPTLNSAIGSLSSTGGWATNQGQQNVSAGSNFLRAITGGDISKIMQVLSPEINAAKGAASQQNKTQEEFGGRSGGTAAGTAARSDTVHSDITNLIGSLTGGAASGLLSSGQGLLSTGIGATGAAAGLSEDQVNQWANSILGLGLTKAAGYGLGFGLSKI